LTKLVIKLFEIIFDKLFASLIFYKNLNINCLAACPLRDRIPPLAKIFAECASM